MKTIKAIWYKSWRLMGLPYALHNWLLATGTRIVELVSAAGMLGYALVFAANGARLTTLPLYYKFAALPHWAVVGTFLLLGALQLVLLPFKSPRSNVLSGFLLVVSSLVWFLVLAAFDAARPPANTGMVFPTIMSVLCMLAGSRLVDLSRPKTKTQR